MTTFAALLPPSPLDPIVNEAKSGQLLYEIVGSDQPDTTALLWAGLGVLTALDELRTVSLSVATTQARRVATRSMPRPMRSCIATAMISLAQRSTSRALRVMGV
ncbi:hypothetical protein SEA_BRUTONGASTER_121 [Gordonia phage BrutonGaster]|uniref:Uncharacterized protein n=1 Tax=Gordonia phage BrutonGaster TaxID=2530116 RepID=A0A482JKQ6_9CAUD|nr:hypothetical protein HOV26_gp061 [Gordonia phage BrutonGaster]QBP33336.1 hypothetical protein SEA_BRUTONGASTER_121 [Gordonia phage BrutonGaster]